MSCVIGLVTKRGVMLGADSAANDGNILIPNSFKKIIKKTTYFGGAGDNEIEFLIGTCGSMQIGSIVRNFLDIPRVENLSDLDGFMETTFLRFLHAAIVSSGYERDNYGEQAPLDEILVGVQHNLYFIDGNFGIASSMRGYDAIGSSREIALGSLYTTRSMIDAPGPKECILGALDAASSLTINVSAPYQILEAKAVENA